MRRMALCVSGHLRCAIPRDVRARNVFAGANSGHAARGRARQEAGVEPSAARHVPGAALLPFRPRLVRTLTAGSSRGDANAVSDRVAVSLQSDASNTEDTSRAHEAAASGKGAAASPTDTGLDSMRPPPVDWSKYADMEATSTSGRVVTAQANFMRVLVNMKDLTKLQRDTRMAQLQAARQLAEDAGAREDVESLNREMQSEGPLELLCVVRALLKKMQRRIFVGDFVTVSAIDWVASRGSIHELLERRSELKDPPVANADRLVLCFAVTDPPVETVQLTRFLVSAEATGLPFKLVFNKVDLMSPEERADYEGRLRGWGYDPLFVSVRTGEGIEKLRSLLSNQLSVLAGPSGVGKSSLINLVRLDIRGDVIGAGGGNKGRAASGGGGVADWAEKDDAAGFEVQSVGSISERTGRGKHTTRHVTLLRLPGGGLLADTPGFGLPTLENVKASELAWFFPEAVRAAEASPTACMFADCRHHEEPGCVVRTEPVWDRYWIYRELYDEVAEREAAESRQSGKLESNLRYKTKRGGKTQVEVKLEPKKHRRVQRNNMKLEVVKLVEQDALDREDDEDDEGSDDPPSQELGPHRKW